MINQQQTFNDIDKSLSLMPTNDQVIQNITKQIEEIDNQIKHGNKQVKASNPQESSVKFLKRLELEETIKSLESYLENPEMIKIATLISHELVREQYLQSFKFSKLIAEHIETSMQDSKDYVTSKHALVLLFVLEERLKRRLVET
ncbi:MAG: hypothetical protein LN569_03790 [Rickettsia endosymbiont of Labidopullus appendiculatus]|nr:hypothetical protein [Rickettsia endosymbiont of Labidopullus appendiculatus]